MSSPQMSHRPREHVGTGSRRKGEKIPPKEARSLACPPARGPSARTVKRDAVRIPWELGYESYGTRADARGNLPSKQQQRAKPRAVGQIGADVVVVVGCSAVGPKDKDAASAKTNIIGKITLAERPFDDLEVYSSAAEERSPTRRA